jgi:hypothetical protein
MRLISIVLSLIALGFASGAIAQSPSIDRKIAQQQNAKGEYAEKAPFVAERRLAIARRLFRARWPRTLTDPSPSVTAVVKWWLATIRDLSKALWTS